MNCVTSLLFSAPVQTWTYMGYIDKAEDIYYNLQEKKKSKKKKLQWSYCDVLLQQHGLQQLV